MKLSLKAGLCFISAMLLTIAALWIRDKRRDSNGNPQTGVARAAQGIPFPASPGESGVRGLIEQTILAKSLGASSSQHADPQETNSLTAEQKRLLESESQKLLGELQNIEKANSKEIFNSDTGTGHMVALLISQPTPEQLGDFSARASQRLDNTGDEAVKARLRTEVDKMYAEFTRFPKPYRALYMSLNEKNGAVETNFMEVPCSSQTEAMPQEDGSLRGSGTVRVLSAPDNNTDKLWKKRYGHLLSIEDQ